MKNRKFKLFTDKKSTKQLSSEYEINRLRKEIILANAVPILCGVGAICISAVAFNLDQAYSQIKSPFIVSGIMLGAASVFSSITININEGTKRRMDRIKYLKSKTSQTKDKHLRKKR